MSGMNGKQETVLVTGAAGTVGVYVVAQLIAAGKRVVATDRFALPTSFDVPADAALEIRQGDITDPRFCAELVEGIDAVVHLAGAIDLRLPWETLSKINVEAVRHLYEAANQKGCRRFVFFSSGSIYRHQRGPITEACPFDPTSPYEQSKVNAERYLWALPRQGTAVTVVRPSMIYGPRARFLGAKASAIPPMLALFFTRIPKIKGGAVVNWVHAEDAARSAVFLLDHPDAAWQAFNVADETPISFGELLDVITRSYGLPSGIEVAFPNRLIEWLGPTLARSGFALKMASTVTERLWKFIVERDDLMPAISAAVDREAFEYATREVVFDTAKLKRLGFRVKWKSFRDGYPTVLQWFQANRWVPAYRPDDSREWGGSVGFKFVETMAGTWWRTSGSRALPFSFSVTARTSNARQFVREGNLQLEGHVEAEGLGQRQPCAGTLIVRPGWQPELSYDVTFRGEDGRRYRFTGKKQVQWLRFVPTLTYLPGRVYDDRGQIVGRAVTYFDLKRHWRDFIGSFALQAGVASVKAAPASAAAPAVAMAGKGRD